MKTHCITVETEQTQLLLTHLTNIIHTQHYIEIYSPTYTISHISNTVYGSTYLETVFFTTSNEKQFTLDALFSEEEKKLELGRSVNYGTPDVRHTYLYV